MKIRYFFLTLLLILTAIQGMAQRNGVVLDMETRQPLAGVKVYTNEDFFTFQINVFNSKFCHVTKTPFHILYATIISYFPKVFLI